MRERIKPSDLYVDRAFLGGNDVAEGLVIGALADEIAGEWILNPRDDPERQGVAGKAIGFVRKVSDLGVDSVEGLRKKVRDGSDEEKGKAEEGLNRLAGAVYLVMSGNEELKDKIPLGGVGVDKVLPKAWQGLDVVGNLIETEEIIGILEQLDQVRTALGVGTAIGKRKVGQRMDRAIDDLIDLLGKGGKVGKEAETVMAYLAQEMEQLGGVVARRQDVDDLGREGGGRGGAGGPRGVDSDDFSRFGSVEGLGRAVQSLNIEKQAFNELGKVETKEELELWVADQTVKASEGPLFFANWWQGAYSEALWKVVAETKGFERRSAEERSIRKFTRALCSVFGMGEADRNVDDTAATLIQFNPPKNMAKEMMWSQTKFDLLKKHPLIGFFVDEIYNVAFEKGDGEKGYREQGWRIAMAFSSEEDRDSLDNFCDWMIDGLEKNDRWKKHCEDKGISLEGGEYERLHSFVRVALTQFEVDYMPEWIRWCHANKLKERKDRERHLDWFKWEPGNLGEIKGTWDSSMCFEGLDENSKMQKGKIPYHHPRMMRPADLLLAKGSLCDNPHLVANFHRVIKALMARRFRDDKGRLIPCRGSPQLDKYKKWAVFLEFIQGKGIQGTEIDDLLEFGDVIKAAVNYWGKNSEEEIAEGGYAKKGGLRDLLSGLFAVKVEAGFWKGYKSGAADVLLNLMRFDFTYSSEDERRKMMGGLIGGSKAGMRGNYGVFADAARFWKLDFFGKNGNSIAKDALVRVLTDEPDVMKAWKVYKKGGLILDYKVADAVLQGVVGVLGGGGRK